jgi:hypothetical protein
MATALHDHRRRRLHATEQSFEFQFRAFELALHGRPATMIVLTARAFTVVRGGTTADFWTTQFIGPCRYLMQRAAAAGARYAVRIPVSANDDLVTELAAIALANPAVADVLILAAVMVVMTWVAIDGAARSAGARGRIFANFARLAALLAAGQMLRRAARVAAAKKVRATERGRETPLRRHADGVRAAQIVLPIARLIVNKAALPILAGGAGRQIATVVGLAAAAQRRAAIVILADIRQAEFARSAVLATRRCSIVPAVARAVR